MKKPMIFVLIFAIIGIILGMYGSYSEVLIVTCIVFSLNILICIYYKNIYLILLFMVFIFSNIRINDVNMNMVSRENSKSVDMIAIVRTVKQTTYGYSLIVENLHNYSLFPEKYLTYENRKVSEGDVIHITGDEEPFLTNKNPTSFNTYNYYGARNILGEIDNSEITILNSVYDIKTVLYNLQNKFVAVYDKMLPSDKSALMKSMIFGDKSELPAETMDLYRLAGIYHLLVISGLHIGIISIVLVWLFSKFLNYKIARIISALILVLYCVMTGGSVATIRAVLISIVSVSSVLLNRKGNLINSTSFVAFLILMYNPLYLFDVGFKYSFASVYGIAILSNPIMKLIKKCRKLDDLLKYKSLKSALVTSLSVSIFTYPLSLSIYYYLLPYSVLVNMIITPTAVVLVSLGVATALAGVLGEIFAPLLIISEICGGFCYFILVFYEKVCEIFVNLPYAQILVGTLSFNMTILYYILIFVIVGIINRMKNTSENISENISENTSENNYENTSKNTSGKEIRKNLFNAFSIGIVAILIVFVSYIEEPKGLEFTMLDIGQGDAFVLRIDDKYYTIDGGKASASSAIRQYLESKGVNEIEYAFITHTDADHMQGFAEYITEEPKPIINNIVQGNSIYTKDSEDRYFEANVINSNTKNVLIMNKGDKIPIENGYIYCLSPENKSYSNKNEASLVLLIEYMNKRILIPGDIGESTEKELIRNYEDLDVDFYCLSHHGSRYGNTIEFLEEMSPLVTFVSTGRNNTYGHPAQAVVETLEGLNIPLFNTAEDGAIILKIDGNGNVSLKTML